MLRRFETQGQPEDVATLLRGKSEWSYYIARDAELHDRLRSFHEQANERTYLEIDGTTYMDQPLFSALACSGMLLAARTRRSSYESRQVVPTFAVLESDIRGLTPSPSWRTAEASVTDAGVVDIVLEEAPRPNGPLLNVVDDSMTLAEKVALFADQQIAEAAAARYSRRARLSHDRIELLGGYEHIPTQSTEELLNHVALLRLGGLNPEEYERDSLTYMLKSDTI